MKACVLPMCIVFLLPLTVSATYLQIIPTLSAPDVMDGDSVDFPLSVVNNGDESAYNVQLSLLLPDSFSSKNIFFRELKPKETRDGVFSVKISNDTLPGTYAVGLLTHYTDANQYPFSSVNSLPVNYKTPLLSRVLGMIDPTHLKKEPVTLNVTLTNRDEKAHNLRLMFLVPDEMKVDNPSSDVYLDAQGEKQIQVTLSSSGALAGSTYPIIAVATYNEGGQQFSSIIRGVVNIDESSPKNPLNFPPWLPYLGLAVIIGLVLYRKFRR